MAAGTIAIADSERHCRASSLPFARLIFQCNGLRPVGRRVRDQFAPTNALRNLDLIDAPSWEYSNFRCVQGRFHAHGESVAVASVKGMRSHHCYRDLSPLQSCICSRIYVLPAHRHSKIFGRMGLLPLLAMADGQVSLRRSGKSSDRIAQAGSHLRWTATYVRGRRSQHFLSKLYSVCS